MSTRKKKKPVSPEFSTIDMQQAQSEVPATAAEEL